MPKFVSLGRTEHGLTIGVIPSVVARMDEIEISAGLRHALARELDQFVEAELERVIRDEAYTKPAGADEQKPT